MPRWEKTLRERFEGKFIPEPNSGCYLWESTIEGDGYGQIRKNNRYTMAHRVSWELHNGAIPEGLCVLHRCDTPSCVNPDHLFLGTPTDNARDRDEKGRGNPRKGEDHGSAKLTEEDVRAMRASLQSCGKLAFIFDTAKSNVSAIKRRDTWKHLVNVDFSFKNQNLQ